MPVMLFLILLSVVLGGIGLIVFLWALRSGQYDDLDGAAQRILFDDSPPMGVVAPAPQTPQIEG